MPPSEEVACDFSSGHCSRSTEMDAAAEFNKDGVYVDGHISGMINNKVAISW